VALGAGGVAGTFKATITNSGHLNGKWVVVLKGGTHTVSMNGNPLARGRYTATATQPAVWNVVALGDSDTTGEGDATGLGWVGRYARLLRQKLGLKVVVTNLANGGKTSADLLSELRSDAATRAAVKKAQIVLVGIGGADLGAGDGRLEAGTCKGTACYAADLRAFGRNLDATAAVVRKLRSPKQAVLRAITLPNVIPGAEDVVPAFITQAIGVYQNQTLRRFICSAMAKHSGRCVDAFRAFNGPDGTQDAYAKGLLTKNPCCYPSGKGQQVMAGLVFTSGLAPLR
jgi:lysophospholipase L1-like esterase